MTPACVEFHPCFAVEFGRFPRMVGVFRSATIRCVFSRVPVHRTPQPPKLPSRKMIGAMNPTFIEERRRGLELYLQTLVKLPAAWKCAPFVAFLDGPTRPLHDKVCTIMLTV